MSSKLQTEPRRLHRRRRSSRRESDGFDAEARLRIRALLLGLALALVGMGGLALVLSGLAGEGLGVIFRDSWVFPAS